MCIHIHICYTLRVGKLSLILVTLSDPILSDGQICPEKDNITFLKICENIRVISSFFVNKS